MATAKDIDTTFNEMKNAQKIALLLIALGQKWATEIMRLLKPEEVSQISYWIHKTQFVPQELTEKVIKEFYDRLVKKTSLSSSGGQDYLFDVLAGMMGESKAQELIEDLSQKEENEVFRILKKVDPKQLATYLKLEQPQTVAIMLSYIDPGRAAHIIKELPEDRQMEVIIRLAKLEETDPEMVSAMENALSINLISMASKRPMRKIGGLKTVAEILNNVGKDTEKSIMENLTEADFDLATSIKDLMFVFSDLILLDDKSIQTVLKEVDQADLLLALKGTNEGVKEKVFRNISKRQADSINDELSFMGPVKGSVVQQSQQKVVNVIRKLDQEGKVLIQGKGGEDDIIA